MKQNTMSALRVNDMMKCSVFAALIVIGSFIKIPFFIVPFTLQFLFTNLAGLLLGKRLGMLSVALYIFLGLIGLPVFTGGGGIGYVLSPTFGYIIGFMIGAYVAGYFTETSTDKLFSFSGFGKGSQSFPRVRLFRLFLAGLLNLTIVYTIGVIYYYWIAKFYLGPIPIMKLIWGGAIVFIPADALLCFISALIAMRMLPMMKGRSV